MKQKIFKIFAGFIGIVGVALAFQNCAPEGSFRSKTSESFQMASINVENPHTPPSKTQTDTFYDLVLADRFYIKSLMEDIFGPQAYAADSNRIFTNALEFGGACGANASYFKSNNVIADTMENCVFSSTTRLIPSTLPKGSAARQGLLTRACSDWVQNATTLNYALKRISPSESLPAGTRANVLNLYRLFYRGKPEPITGLLESLEMIVNQPGKPTANSWRSAIYTVCSSSYWQVL